MKNKILGMCLLMLTTSFSQNKPLQDYKEKYPDSHYVKLQNDVEISIKIKGDSLEITETSYDEDLYLTSASKNYSKESVSFNSFNALLDVSASSFSIEDGKYVEYKVKEFKKKDELAVSFHDDIQSLNFIYPNLGEGSKTQLVKKYAIKNPRFLSSFYLGAGVPFINSHFKVIVDNDVAIEFKEFHTDSLTIETKVNKKRNKTIYEWTVKNVEAIDVLRNSPSFKNYFPHIVPVIKSYKGNKGEDVKVCSDVDALFNWYYSLTEDVKNETCDTALVNTVEELVKDKETELEKVEAIYYWAQKNIKYVAFEYNLGGFVPRKSNDIYKKKYGDCKDNSMILYNMLKIAGIKSGLTWIGTRSIPYKYNELPTPAVDNHMILAYENDGKTYFLDATGRYMKLGLPTSFIQGKEALIGYDKDHYKIVEVPVITADVTQNIDSSYLKIEEKNLVGSGEKYLTGYFVSENFNYLEGVKNEKDKLNFYRGFLNKGSNKFQVSNIKEHHKFTYDKDFNVTYDFKIMDYVSSYEDELYVNLNLKPILKHWGFLKDRKADFEDDYKQFFDYHFELEIPEGYTVEYVPENVIVKNDDITSSITYTLEGNKIVYSHKVKCDYLVIKKENFEGLLSEIKKMTKAYKEVIVLKKKK